VRIAIAKAGLDPGIGYLHVCRPGRDSLVYDLMEPYRPQVDRDILVFVQPQTFTPRDFVIDSKGVRRLHPELARNLALAVATAAGPCVATIWVEKLLDSELHAGPGGDANPAVESSLSRGGVR
jgi:hypothetical protein